MTQMSASGRARSWTIADFPLLARISLHTWIVLLFGAPSCLVTSTTEYPEPVPSPPFIDANTALATPAKGGTPVPLTRLLRVSDDTERVTFSADVRAEDNGRPLSARVFVDYQVTAGREYTKVGFGDSSPPDIFDHPRSISASLPIYPGDKSLPDGCYQVAFVVSHDWNAAGIPADQTDSAIVVWWMIKGDPSGVSMSSCPGMAAGMDGGAGR
jgi:hypothetical protein